MYSHLKFLTQTCLGWFVSYLVRNPEDRLSHDEPHFINLPFVFEKDEVTLQKEIFQDLQMQGVQEFAPTPSECRDFLPLSQPDGSGRSPVLTLYFSVVSAL